MAKYITFAKCPRQKDFKTDSWDVLAKGGVRLGGIAWYGAWRQYSFFPQGDTIFEKQCLRDIAAFCEVQTAEHLR